MSHAFAARSSLRTVTHTLARALAHALVLLPSLMVVPAQAASTPAATSPTPTSAPAPHCTRTDLNLVVLGSGGPEPTDQRAGSGYLLREGDRARFLIDFGPGTSQTFERVRAQIADLHAVLFTHLHVDHTNDLPALVKASFFSTRSRDLPIYGPSGNDTVPPPSCSGCSANRGRGRICPTI